MRTLRKSVSIFLSQNEIGAAYFDSSLFGLRETHFNRFLRSVLLRFRLGCGRCNFAVLVARDAGEPIKNAGVLHKVFIRASHDSIPSVRFS